MMPISVIAISVKGYPRGCSSSGMYLKFIPYMLAINVKGRNIADIAESYNDII